MDKKILKLIIGLVGINMVISSGSVFAVKETNKRKVAEDIEVLESKKMKIEGVDKSYEYSDYYTMLRDERNTPEEQARKQAGVYVQEISKGKSHQYAESYTYFSVIKGLEERKAREATDLYLQERSNKKSRYYAYYYAMLKIKNIFPEEEARCQAKTSEQFKIQDDNCKYWMYCLKSRNSCNLGEKI